MRPDPSRKRAELELMAQLLSERSQSARPIRQKSKEPKSKYTLQRRKANKAAKKARRR
jgi:hypothetical protein